MSNEALNAQLTVLKETVDQELTGEQLNFNGLPERIIGKWQEGGYSFKSLKEHAEMPFWRALKSALGRCYLRHRRQKLRAEPERGSKLFKRDGDVVYRNEQIGTGLYHDKIDQHWAASADDERVKFWGASYVKIRGNKVRVIETTGHWYNAWLSGLILFFAYPIFAILANFISVHPLLLGLLAEVFCFATIPLVHAVLRRHRLTKAQAKLELEVTEKAERLKSDPLFLLTESEHYLANFIIEAGYQLDVLRGECNQTLFRPLEQLRRQLSQLLVDRKLLHGLDTEKLPGKFGILKVVRQQIKQRCAMIAEGRAQQSQLEQKFAAIQNGLLRLEEKVATLPELRAQYENEEHQMDRIKGYGQTNPDEWTEFIRRLRQDMMRTILPRLAELEDKVTSTNVAFDQTAAQLPEPDSFRLPAPPPLLLKA